MASPLERALRRFRPAGPSGPRPHDGDRYEPSRYVTLAEFRAATEQRLRGLEREIVDVKARVNGLLLLLAGAMATQVVLRLVE